MSASYYTKILDGNFNITSGGGAKNSTKSNSQQEFQKGPRFEQRDSDETDTDTVSTKAIKSQNSISISGGSFFGTGASNMAQTFDQSSQGVIAVSVGNQSAGTKITLSDGSDNVIAERTPELSY